MNYIIIEGCGINKYLLEVGMVKYFVFEVREVYLDGVILLGF